MKQPLGVSVIIPNYNHAAYLPQRITSVLSQTYQNFELIILDDCSPDGSREVIQRYARQHPQIKTIFNERNSGSPFAQWNRGVAAARGKYVWIAESDDYADPRLLDNLVAKLEQHPTASLAYCQSWVVNVQGDVIDNMRYWTDPLDTEHWTHDYCTPGDVENRRFLFHKPTIPNTSAVVFRKDRYAAIGGANEDFTMCGDWLHWIRMVEGCELCFVAEPLNYFRRHEATTRTIRTHGRVLTKIYEEYRILAYILTRIDSKSTLAERLRYDYLRRSFDFCPARLKFSPKFIDFVRIVKNVDSKVYYRLVLFIFKRFITYLPSKLGSRSIRPTKSTYEFEEKSTH